MKLIIDIPDNEILIGWYTRSDGVNQYHNAKTLGEPNYIPLDKIRAEIDRQEKWLLQAGYTAYNADIAFDAIKSVLVESEERNENV